MFIFVLFLSGLACFSPFILRFYTDWRFGQDIYTVESAPAKPVALVFGAQVYRSGRLSAMLADRVAAAAALYHAGKVDYVLMTGYREENTAYDEPGAMRRYAMTLGVPSESILLDPLGLRTYDSCYRAQRVYDIHEAILVTQNFHLDRALMLCQGLGIDAVGVAADDQRPTGYSPRSMRWQMWREVALLDLIRRPMPSLEATTTFPDGLN